MEKRMIKVSVFYPNGNGHRFDMDYYCKNHLPMVMKLLSPALKSGAVEKGIAGMTSDAPASFLAMGHLYFDTVADFQQSFAPHADKIMGDIPNYTNTQPIVQISEVVI